MENPKHQIFVNGISRHGNKTRAYKEAYPDTTDESARVGATKLLKRPDIKAALKDMYIELRLGITNDKHAYIFQEAKILKMKREYALGILNGDCYATINEKLRALELDNRLMEMEMVLLGYGSIKQAKHEYMYQGFAHTYQQLTAEQAVAAILEADKLSDNTSPLPGVSSDECRKDLGVTDKLSDNTSPLKEPVPLKREDLGVEVTNSETVTFRNLEQEQDSAEQADNTLDNNALAEAVAYNPHPAPVTSDTNNVTYIPLGLKQSPDVKQPSIIKRAKQHKPATVFNNAKPGKRRA